MRKLFKKSLACCLALALCFTLFAGAITVNAELTTNPAYSTEDVTVAPGESTTIKFTIKDFAEIQGVILKVYVPSVVASIDAVTVDGIELVEWNDETGEGNYQVDKENKFIKFMTLANFEGVDNVAALTFDINVTVDAEAEAGEYGYTAPVIQATDGDVLVPINGQFGKFTVEEKEPEVPALEVKFASTGKSLLFNDIVYIKTFFHINDTGLTEDEVAANSGLLVWMKNTVPADAAAAIHGTETYTVDGMTKNGMYKGYMEYYALTQGIPVSEYTDAVAFRPYIKINGNYYYGDIVNYGVQDYCENQLKKTETTKITPEFKKGLIAMLNYGSIAQEYFGYNVSALANENLATLAAEGYFPESYLDAVKIDNWDGSLLDEPVAPTDDMIVNFAANGSATDNGKSCVFGGAVTVKYYCGLGFDATIVDKIASKTTYVWRGTDYETLKAAGTPLTKENATYTVEMGDFSYTGAKYGVEGAASTQGIPAKELADTIYVAHVVVDTDGVEHCSGVIAYSPEKYASNQLNKTTENAVKMHPLLKAMVIYGQGMTDYFASIA